MGSPVMAGLKKKKKKKEERKGPAREKVVCTFCGF